MYRKNYNFDNLQLINFVNMNEEQALKILEWRNHVQVRCWVYDNRPISHQQHLTFIKSLQKDNKNFYWTVHFYNEPIGVISLNRVNYSNKHAYIGLYGNMLSERKGKGLLLMKSLLYMGFDIMKLHTLKLEVFENNNIAIRLYKKIGFEQEGVLRDFVYRNDKWINVIVMGRINEEEEH